MGGAGREGRGREAGERPGLNSLLSGRTCCEGLLDDCLDAEGKFDFPAFDFSSHLLYGPLVLVDTEGDDRDSDLKFGDGLVIGVQLGNNLRFEIINLCS